MVPVFNLLKNVFVYLQEERQEKKTIAKHRYLGHLRFIGDLYIQKLLKESKLLLVLLEK